MKINKTKKAFYDAIRQRKKRINFLNSMRASESGEQRQQSQQQIQKLQKQISYLNDTLREGNTMKVKIKRAVLKEAVKQVIKEGAILDKVKRKFGGNVDKIKAWVKRNWDEFNEQYKQTLKNYMSIKQDVGNPTRTNVRLGTKGQPTMNEVQKSPELRNVEDYIMNCNDPMILDSLRMRIEKRIKQI